MFCSLKKNIAYYLYTPLRDDSMHTLYCDRLIFLSLKKLCEGIITVSNRLDIKYLLEVNIAPSLDFISIFHSFNDTCKYRPLYCAYSVLVLHLDTKTKNANGN